MLGARYEPVGTDFSDSRDPIFNSMDPNWVPKTPQKHLVLIIINEF